MTRRLSMILLFAALAIQAHAQAVPFVTIQRTAESLALGGAHVAGPWNLPLEANVFEAGIGKTYWQKSAINYNLTNVDARVRVLDNLSVGLLFTYNNMEETTLYSSSGQPLGTTQPTELYAGLTASYAPVEKLALNLSGKYIHSALTDHNTAGAPAFDIGAIWRVGRSVSLGVLGENLGPAISYGYGSYPLPATIKTGYYGLFNIAQKHAIETAADLGAMPAYSAALASLGAGYIYNRTVALRFGAHICTRGDILPTYASAGLFVTTPEVDIGAAYLSASNTFSISARLKL